LFGLIKQWNKCGSFNSLKEAMAEICDYFTKEEFFKARRNLESNRCKLE
jgi:hypothetical protein